MSSDPSPSKPPFRQEIWLVQLGAGRKGEIGKTRPAVVVSRDEVRAQTEYGLVTVVPFTRSSRLRASAVRPLIAAGHGLEWDSVAICDSPFAGVASRFVRYLGRLPDEDFAKVIAGRALVEGWPGASAR
ncbi:MAG: type II toxin-antitoxin system PemK/MazF family toxin [Bifidobacteriaceae bacterium]|jgi:mRNA interferase MazF|nr:type II toxin-antitoxin system PemK/MazF family toxin [Bifidobacteriaceae bacterium]